MANITLVVGDCNTGKSTSLLQYLAENPGKYQEVMIVSKTDKPLYRILQKLTGVTVNVYRDTSELPGFEYSKGVLKLLVLDDDFSKLLVLDNDFSKLCRNFLVHSRSLGVHLYCLAQNYRSIPSLVRKLAMEVLLFEMCNKLDRDFVLRQLMIPEEMYDECTAEMFGYLQITKNTHAIQSKKLTVVSRI